MSVETIEQFYFTVDPERKFELLEQLLEREQPRQAIVFCRTKRGTDKIYRRLSQASSKDVAMIHGDLAAKRPRPRDGGASAPARSASWWPPTWSAAAST